MSIIYTGYLLPQLYARKGFKVSFYIWMHICGSQLSHPSDPPCLILNLACEAADWTLLITLNACSVFFLKEGHQQMSVRLYCGTRRLCVGIREQAVVTGFCWLHPLLPFPRQMWLTVRGCEWQAAPWWSISEFRAVKPRFSLAPELVCNKDN